MKKFLAILGVFALGTSSLATAISFTTSTISNSENKKSTLTQEEFSQELMKASENFINKKEGNEQFLKVLLLDSIEMIDDHYSLNIEKLSVIKNEEIYNYLVDKHFDENLAQMIDHETLLINESNIDFKNMDNEEISLSTFDIFSFKGNVWVTSHWYWFGYWELRFDIEASASMANIIKDGLSEGIDVVFALLSAVFPPAATVAAIIAVYIYKYKIAFENPFSGTTMGFWAFVPVGAWPAVH